MNRRIVLTVSLLAMLSACAEQQQRTPAYVSPLEFKNYSCKQISKEMAYVSAQMNQANSGSDMGTLLTAGLMAYGMSQGMAVSSDGEDPQMENLRARYNALHQASIQKNCD